MELAQACDARILQGDPELPVRQISTDTRALGNGDCFIALQGPRFDGHEFLSVAAERGASAAVVSIHPTRAINSPSVLALLQVPDTLTALHKLATSHRRLKLPATRLVAISGACGKTSTKEMIAAVLAQRYPVHKTPANNNNHIGVPRTLLDITPDHRYGVIELGSNHPGEMRVLAEIVQPDIAVVTNIGLAHAEFMGDEAGVAREEGVPLEYLPRDGQSFVVLNADDRWCSELRARTRANVVTVGIENYADVRASEIRINGDVKFRLNISKKRDDVYIRLRTLGRHQIYNALQAAAVGYMEGMDLDEIREGLETMDYPEMRMQTVHRAGIRFVNDCYNANLPSMTAALQMIHETPVKGRKIAVLGDMLELGEHAPAAHLEIGALAAQAGLALLVAVGPQAKLIADGAVNRGMESHRVLPVNDARQAADLLRWLLRDGDFVLLKGSRGMKLEQILQAFELK
jgi:UDP-N-acetylmuramoyl-tripeptide--D-alanyl-D-alanine ligase